MTIYTNKQFTHEAAQAQIERIKKLAEVLGVNEFEIMHSHTSKSVELPVPTLRPIKGLTFMIRDNFHDLNLYVHSSHLIDIQLSVFHESKPYEWYVEQMTRKRNYCFSDWTDEEIDDERILRVRRRNGNGFQSVHDRAKDRWARRREDTSWYENDWSSRNLIADGPVPFDENTIFYLAERAHGEGIPFNVRSYVKPCHEFMLALPNWEEGKRVCGYILQHVEKLEAGA